ncbi:ABC transporter permease subunit, partial [Clostridium sp.]
MTVGSRSIRMMAILFVFNSILAAVALFNMYSVAEQVRTTAEIQYSQFLDLYTFVSSIEFIMLLFIMPALTASSISGERERQTLELMLTTTMEPRDMVLGKLASSLVTMLVLAVSALPVQALVFVYGGVTLQDIGMLFLCHGVVAILTGSIGI